MWQVLAMGIAYILLVYATFRVASIAYYRTRYEYFAKMMREVQEARNVNTQTGDKLDGV